MKLCEAISFWTLLGVVRSNEIKRPKYSLLESHAIPMLDTELQRLRIHAEERYNFSLRIIPFFEMYFTIQPPSIYTMALTQILGGSSQITLETSQTFKNILNEIWSITPDFSDPRVEQFDQCIKNEMGVLRTEQIVNWAKELVDENDRQIELGLNAIRRAMTSTEVDIMMINAANAECVARALLTLSQRYSGHDVCYRRSPLKNCSQQCYYVEETAYCTRSWYLQKNTSTSEIRDIVDSLVNPRKYEDFSLDDEIFPSYVTEENFNVNVEHLEIVAPFYFTLRNNVTEIWQSLENQRRVVAYIRDGLPQRESIHPEFDFDSLPGVSKKDDSMAEMFLECNIQRRRQNYQDYFYERLHCNGRDFVAGMLIVANLVDEFNMARIGLECYAGIEDTIFNKYTEIISDLVLPDRIRD